jgi:ribosomal-protein-alanine N-acetyltransferase
VDSARWGQGVGSELLRQLLAEAKRRDCTEVFLEVRADNTRAQRLYRWWGFAEVGIRRSYYQPSGMDAIVMRRDLTGPAPTGPGEANADIRPGASDTFPATGGIA